MLPIYLTGPAVGIILKELVRRAMMIIRGERFVLEATAKEGYGGQMDDVFTSADTKAQAIFAKLLQETMPGVGLIGEEGLRVPCSILGMSLYVTIDPLDGTKAFVRKRSTGVATMVALVKDGEVISAWVGDVNTLEIYGYRPGSPKVHRIYESGYADDLSAIPRTAALLDEQHLLLRNYDVSRLEPVLAVSSRMRDVKVEGGSIGIWFSQLWKGEVGSVILEPGIETPWDSTPVVGISMQLGFVFLKPDGSHYWQEYVPRVAEIQYPRGHLTLVVHRSIAHQFFRPSPMR